MCNLDKKEFFLVEEYKSAVELTFHIDSLRNKLTSFFISISGIALTGLFVILKNEDGVSVPKNINEIISILMMTMALLGYILILILARIRKIQLEHFGIINNIRKYFYEDDYNFWNASQLSTRTLPSPSFFSGTYFWLLLIQVLNVIMIFLGLFLFNNPLKNILTYNGISCFLIIGIVSLLIQNITYFYFASPPVQKTYSVDNTPY